MTISCWEKLKWGWGIRFTRLFIQCVPKYVSAQYFAKIFLTAFHSLSLFIVESFFLSFSGVHQKNRKLKKLLINENDGKLIFVITVDNRQLRRLNNNLVIKFESMKKSIDRCSKNVTRYRQKFDMQLSVLENPVDKFNAKSSLFVPPEMNSNWGIR